MTLKSNRLNAMVKILISSFGLIFATWLAVVGYLVAPTLFSSLDSVQAGNLVGKLLSATNFILLAALLILVIAKSFFLKTLASIWMLLLSALIVIVSEFWLTPKMQLIKEQYPQGILKSSEHWHSFMAMHGVYQLLFLTLILLLVVWSLANLNRLFLENQLDDKKSL